MKPKVLHVCCACHKAFPQRHRLIVHMAKHSEVRNFSCAVCQKRFKSKGSLSYHAYSHLKNGDIDTMDWFPELITPSRRKQRAENKRRNLTCENVVPISLDRSVVSASEITTATETSGCSGSGSNWTDPSAEMAWRNYVEDQQSVSNAEEENKQQSYCGGLINPAYAAREPYVLQNNNALPNEQCTVANGTRSSKLLILKSSNGQQYYMHMNANLEKMQAEGLQSAGPVHAGVPEHWQAPAYWQQQGESDSEFRFLPSYGGFCTSTPKVQTSAQKHNGTTEAYNLENLQPSPIGYSPSQPPYCSPLQHGYESFQSYGTDGLDSWGTATENKFQNFHPPRSLDNLNEAVYASYYELGNNAFLHDTRKSQKETTNVQAATAVKGFQRVQPSTSWNRMNEPPVVSCLRNCEVVSPPMVDEIIYGMPSTSQGKTYAYMTSSKSMPVYKQRGEMELGDNRSCGSYFGSDEL
ncbi:hypothetical protein D918_04862 [Trichuris suis]|nr:hypothetical protein D918_04862 [Trichuris suis]